MRWGGVREGGQGLRKKKKKRRKKKGEERKTNTLDFCSSPVGESVFV